MISDAETVRAFEHAGWQRTAAEYDASFAPATAGFIDALLDAAGVTTGKRVLDIGCGHGPVASAASRRGGLAVGLDFSSAMLAEARAAHPALRFDEADAEALPYYDGTFDAVVASFAIHHVPRPAMALAEAHRVLRPGGRFAFTAWAAPADNVAFRLVFDAIAGKGVPAATAGPVPGGNLGIPEALTGLLDAAGFADGAIEKVRRAWHIATPAALVAALQRGTVRMAAMIAAQPADAMPQIIAEIARLATPYTRAAGYELPLVALLAHGIKR
jgi:SAM-dependent methyltransferase